MSKTSVSIASTMRFHYEKLALQLNSMPGFKNWYSFMRINQISSNIQEKLITVSNVGLFFNFLGRRLTHHHISPQIAIFIKSIGDMVFDFEVLVNLFFRPRCNIFVGLSLNVLWSGLYTKNNGGKFILDVPIAHPLYMNKVLSGEFSEFNLKYIDFSRFHISRMQKSFLMADHIVCPSDFVKSSLVKYNVDPKKISVIPYGCSKVGNNHRKNHNIPNSIKDQFNILFVGQLSVRKGLHYLLSAFADLKVPNKHLYLIGSKVAETDTILSKYDLDNISLLGVCDKETLDFYYTVADVFVLPSLIEGLALVLGEALAYGLPIIYTYETGGSNLLTNCENGLLIQSKSSLEIQHSIEFLSSNSHLRRKISDNNIKLSKQLQGWDTYGEAWKKLLYDV